MSVIDDIKTWLSSTDPEERAAGAELALEDSVAFASLDLKTQVLCRVLRGSGEDFRAVIGRTGMNPRAVTVLNELLKTEGEQRVSERIVDLLSEVGDVNSVSILLRHIKGASVQSMERAEAIFGAVAGIIGRTQDARTQANLETRIKDVNLPRGCKGGTEGLLKALSYRKRVSGNASRGGSDEYLRWLGRNRPNLFGALMGCRNRMEGNRHMRGPGGGTAGWRAVSRAGSRR